MSAATTDVMVFRRGCETATIHRLSRLFPTEMLHFHLILISTNSTELHGEDRQYVQLVRKFPVFYGTKGFTTVLTRTGHRSLS
jgi:hypothetical protein